MKDVHLVTFATEDFVPYQNDLINSAKSFGISKGFHYRKENLIHTDFYIRNIEIFKRSRGYGYWLWKPYFILEALNKVKENDIIFYVDAGAKFILDPTPLVDIARTNKSGIVTFNHWPVVISQFTKRDTFINLKCDNKDYWNANIIMAGIMLLKKNNFTVQLIKKWLKECENINSLSDNPNIHGKDNLPGFIAHREDQSIFSILIKKLNIETYRDPSKWGNFLKMIEYRHDNEIVCYPWFLNNSIKDYSTSPMLNSPYDTIFELNRKQNNNDYVTQKKSIFKKYFKKIFHIKGRRF